MEGAHTQVTIEPTRGRRRTCTHATIEPTRGSSIRGMCTHTHTHTEAVIEAIKGSSNRGMGTHTGNHRAKKRKQHKINVHTHR